MVTSSHTWVEYAQTVYLPAEIDEAEAAVAFVEVPLVKPIVVQYAHKVASWVEARLRRRPALYSDFRLNRVCGIR